MTIANSCLQPSVWGRSASSFPEQQLAIWFVNKSMVCSQEDLIYGLRPLKVVCNGLMPKAMVLLAVVSRVPSMWYSLFDRNFLLEMFRVLHFAMPRLICKVWLQLESWVVLLKRNLIRSLRSDLVHCIICSQWEKLCVSQNLTTLPSCLHVLINLHCTQQLQILVTALYVQCTLCTLWLR